MKKLFFLFLFLIFVFPRLSAQKYCIDARITSPKIVEGHLRMGNAEAEGKKIIATNKYLTLGGQPIIPVMGEIHYARIPRDKWEDRILKMEANGITIIASYVFWIHHEEIEGTFDWSANKNLRDFVKLCQKHDVWVYPRIGP